MLYWLCSSISAVLTRLFFGVKVFGIENIPKKGGFILASNHTSYLDPVILGAFCPRKVSFMARHDLFAHPLAGWFLRRLNAFPVRRGKADISALKEAIRRLKGGEPLVIFPEGIRGTGQELDKPEPGVGLIVKKTEAQVVPAFIKGTAIAWPRDKKFMRPAKIRVFFGKQISMERGLSREAIAGEIMRQISRLSCWE